MIKHALLLVSVAVSTSACCGSGGEELPIESASLSGWSEAGFAVIGGYAGGSATLTTTDSAGQSKSTGVDMGGPIFGFVFDMHATPDKDSDLGGCGDASLTVPDGGVSEDELFQLYTGEGTDVGMILGYSEHDLENDAGVRFKTGGVSVGMGVFVGFEWMGLSKN